MKCFIALASAAMLAAPSAPAIERPKWSAATPPARFNAEGVAIVMFVHPDKIKEACAAVGTPPKDKIIVACTLYEGETAYSVMPHPIYWAGDEWFAQVMAHELAHQLKNWRHEVE